MVIKLHVWTNNYLQKDVLEEKTCCISISSMYYLLKRLAPPFFKKIPFAIWTFKRKIQNAGSLLTKKRAPVIKY